MSNSKDILPFGRGLEQLVDSLDAKLHEKDQTSRSGINTLDQILCGFEPGNLYVVASVPGMGKSSFVETVAIELTLSQMKSGIYFHLEGSQEMLATKLVASLGRIDILKLRSGRLDDNDWKRVSSATSLLSKLQGSLHIFSAPKLFADQIEAMVYKLANSTKIEFLIFDYMQRVFFNNSEIRAVELGDLARLLKSIAIALNIPVIAVSQLNRRLEQRPDKRPILGDLRESGAVEEEADALIFVYRDEYYDRDSIDKGMAELIVAKNRLGPVGLIRATYLPQFRRFENYVSDEPLT